MPSKKLKVVKKKIVKKPAAKTVVKKAPTSSRSAELRGTSKIEASAKGGSGKIEVSAAKKTVSLNASVLDVKGKTIGRIGLPPEIFAAKINNSLMSQAVRVYLANQKLGTAKIKERGEVDRTTKKIYQQKGTGRARHGSRRAPIYVGGGKVFGPRPHDLSLNLSKKMKTLALFSALSSKLKDSQIKIIKGLEAISPKTKLMAQVLRNLGVNKTTKILLVIPKTTGELESVYRASRNIEGVEILSANLLNTYQVLDNALILMMKDSVDSLKNTFIRH